MAKEPTWKSLRIANASVKRWQDLGIGPNEFALFRKFRKGLFATGRKDESERVWKLISAGFPVERLVVLMEDDSDLLDYLFALIEMGLEITPDRLSRFEDLRWELDVYLPSEVVEWVELGLTSDDLDALRDAELIDRCNSSDLERIQTTFAKLRWETSANSTAELMGLIRGTAERLGSARVRALVDSGEFASVVSDIQVAEDEATETDLYESGHYGDWKSLGISQYGMDFYTTYFGENSTDADVLVDELRFLFSLGFSHDEMYSKVQRGFKLSQIQAMRQAGLPIDKRTIEEWGGASDPKVILFFVDNGFTTDDRSDVLFEWNLAIDLIEPWWEFCKKQNWITRHSRAQLISGVDHDDMEKVPHITTPDDEPVAELLDLYTYLTWREYGGMHNKFTEIQRWRKCGFEIESWRYERGYSGLGDPPPNDPLGWKKLKFSPNEAILWIAALKQYFFTVSPTAALAWKQAGVSAESVADWLRVGVKTPAEAAAWIRSGADAETAATRKKAGILPPSN